MSQKHPLHEGPQRGEIGARVGARRWQDQLLGRSGHGDLRDPLERLVCDGRPLRSFLESHEPAVGLETVGGQLRALSSPVSQAVTSAGSRRRETASGRRAQMKRPATSNWSSNGVHWARLTHHRRIRCSADSTSAWVGRTGSGAGVMTGSYRPSSLCEPSLTSCSVEPSGLR